MTEGIHENEPDSRIVYADIIDMPHQRSKKHEHMSLYDRAAMFSPFAALTGYEDMIAEEGRVVDSRLEVSEARMEILSRKLALIRDIIEAGSYPVVTITYFVPDNNKNGGAYTDITAKVHSIDDINRQVELFEKVGLSGTYMRIDIDMINDISGELVKKIEY